VCRAAGSGNDDFEAAINGGFSIFEQKIWREPMMMLTLMLISRF
jgi:hypothetical protein